jgi:hypothetical protein
MCDLEGRVTTALQRAAQERVPGLLPLPNGAWRGECPMCSHLSRREQPAFYVYNTFWNCTVCGARGDLVCMLMTADGMDEAHARAAARELEAEFDDGPPPPSDTA